MINKERCWTIVCLFIAANFIHCNMRTHEVGHKQLFDLNWKFNRGDAVFAAEVNFNDQNWQTLDLPHDWSEERDLFPLEPDPVTDSLSYVTGWYRKHFKIPHTWENKTILIDFEGICIHAEIFVNGTPIVDSLKGNTFQTILNPYLNYQGNNVIAIRITIPNQRNQTSQSESGIYKHTWLIIKDSPEVNKKI
jgi:beta-galactosidase